MGYDRTVSVKGAFEQVQREVRHALAEQGFGILTEIDVQATLKASSGTTWSPT